MRITTLLAVPLLAALIALPTGAKAQVSGSISIGARTGTELRISAYSPQQHGQWQTSYRRWTPVTVYEYNGHYYRNQVRDKHNRGVGHPVSMYRDRNGYFSPPTDQGWAQRGRGRNRQ
jgi:hypothetical protein